jgi:hypothetical protein
MQPKNKKNNEMITIKLDPSTKEEPIFDTEKVMDDLTKIEEHMNIESFRYRFMNFVKHAIVFDFINKLLGKTQKTYALNELTDVTISNEKFKKAMDDVRDKSLYFENETSNRKLFLSAPLQYKPIDQRTQTYYYHVVKAILKSYYIILKKYKTKNGSVYKLSIDNNIKSLINLEKN